MSANPPKRRPNSGNAVEAGIDVRALAQKILALDFMQAELPTHRRGLQRLALDVCVRHRKTQGGWSAGTTGRAWAGQFRMTLTFGPGATAGTVRWLVAHEVAHLVPAPRVGANRDIHGPAWRARFLRIVAAVWHLHIEDRGEPYAELDQRVLAELRRASTPLSLAAWLPWLRNLRGDVEHATLLHGELDGVVEEAMQLLEQGERGNVDG